MKKIYFAGSISGGRSDVGTYNEIIKYLGEHGDVLTEHVGHEHITDCGEDDNTDEYIYKRDMEWLESADVVIAEVTVPSFGVGFEISKAASLKKKILCLRKMQEGKRLSAMISGCPDVLVRRYNTVEEAIDFIKNFLKE